MIEKEGLMGLIIKYLKKKKKLYKNWGYNLLVFLKCLYNGTRRRGLVEYSWRHLPYLPFS